MRGTHPNSQKNLKPFEKGESGNPSGRTKAFSNIKDELKELASEEIWRKVEVSDGFDIDFSQYEDRLIGTRKEIVFNVIWELAQKGDKWAIELLERLGCLD